MISVALLAHRSSRGKHDSKTNQKKPRTETANRSWIEKVTNPNPSQRTEMVRLTWALVASTSRAPVTLVRRRTGWTRSAARRRAAQSRTPRARVLRKGLHRQPARRWRAPARESARAGEGGDGGAGRFLLRPESRRPCAKETGEERKLIRVWLGNRPPAGFAPPRTPSSRPIGVDG